MSTKQYVLSNVCDADDADGRDDWTASLASRRMRANRAESPLPQASNDSVADSVRELREQVRELQAAVAEMRSELAAGPRGNGAKCAANWKRSRAQSRSREMRCVVEAVARTSALSSRNAAMEAAQRRRADRIRRKSSHAASLEEEYELLSGKVDDQYQTKVESASKYRVRLSGIVLMNLFSNSGTVDSIDLPTLAYAKPAGVSGREFRRHAAAIGNWIRSFRAEGSGREDAGGLATRSGVADFPRLQTASIPGCCACGPARCVWTGPILPWSPVRMDLFLAELADIVRLAGDSRALLRRQPVGMGAADPGGTQSGVGRRIKHGVSGRDSGPAQRRSPESTELLPSARTRRIVAPAGVRDPGSMDAQRFRTAAAVGLGGYYSRQNYGYDRNVDAWAGMTDFELPLSHQFSLSGKLYRGKGLGGLYGGIGRSVLFSGDPAYSSTAVRGLNAVGGWAQLKYRPASKLGVQCSVWNG